MSRLHSRSYRRLSIAALLIVYRCMATSCNRRLHDGCDAPTDSGRWLPTTTARKLRGLLEPRAVPRTELQ
jgi:hypothetical protein